LDANETVRRDIAGLLSEQRLATLSTCNDQGHPYASLIAFDVTEDLTGIVFATSRATRKFANLTDNRHAAMLVENSRNLKSDIYEAMAVTALGVVSELSGTRRDTALAHYVRKHPHLTKFIQAPSTAVLQLAVDVYYLVNRFQKVMEYHVGRKADPAAGRDPAG
jgi:nitroimidazol reductase NimA-like FMN-containing flavoprotein (pyridoxamine 5'-phosphate oxidase superfamily)